MCITYHVFQGHCSLSFPLIACYGRRTWAPSPHSKTEGWHATLYRGTARNTGNEAKSFLTPVSCTRSDEVGRPYHTLPLDSPTSFTWRVSSRLHIAGRLRRPIMLVSRRHCPACAFWTVLVAPCHHQLCLELVLVSVLSPIAFAPPM
jgi:hypothetical protein